MMVPFDWYGCLITINHGFDSERLLTKLQSVVSEIERSTVSIWRFPSDYSVVGRIVFDCVLEVLFVGLAGSRAADSLVKRRTVADCLSNLIASARGVSIGSDRVRMFCDQLLKTTFNS